MKIAVPRETADGETRVALTPQIAAQLIADGAEVLVQAGAGEASSNTDEAYREAGAKIVPDAPALYGQADLVLRVGRPSDEEVEMLREGTVLIGTLGTLAKPELAQKLAERGVTAISMDAIPRITRAQSMDTLSSQATVGGYKAVLIAAERLPKFMPLLTTAAGTVRPARGIVMGAGVAGLMAIGTARRLGAVVEATDVRPVVKEQVQSLGGTFIEVEMTDEEKAKAETAGGYATEMSEDYKRRQAELIAERVKEADFIITTALIPGRPAPKLVSEAMVKSMKPGSVIVDMAAEMGGNCELTEPGREVVKHGVRIIGITNLPATMPGSATQMYAKNIQTLVKHLVKDGALKIDLDDEITRGATITHAGKVVHEATAKALGKDA
jgi:NAD(P) transhydrogenase subunit alpha